MFKCLEKKLKHSIPLYQNPGDDVVIQNVVFSCLYIMMLSHAYQMCYSHIPDCKVSDKFELFVNTPSLSVSMETISSSAAAFFPFYI